LLSSRVAGGASAATRLRRLNESAEIILFEKGEYVSYANCGLPYYIGGTIKDKERLIVAKPPIFTERFNIDLRIQSEVLKIDREKKAVTVKNLETARSMRKATTSSSCPRRRAEAPGPAGHRP
jgi:NADPH-dependent 2,4-dienoyl-CoA reductase/sulfur reductase-like enzyme